MSIHIRKDFGLRAHQLKPIDHRMRCTFGECVENEIALDPHFQNKILFTDEAHFCSNDFVNKQNYRIWNETNSTNIY